SPGSTNGKKNKVANLYIIVPICLFVCSPEVRDEEWEECGPDIAALHHLRGLSEHMFHENIRNPPNHTSLVMKFFSPLHRDTTVHGARDVSKSVSREDIDQNPMSLLADLQENENFTASVIQKEQDFEGLLAAIDKQKTQDGLLSASEISHSYSQKLLVMTDNEKSTNDRVQQEYSMDPRYSVIVSNECLFNILCVPEADSYTLVKIFGRVSEDGQTVSGLSGSSLAELMLNRSLETAPVFSLDGNTTKDFQHNFIRVFTARGITAVLETNQENHQTYQVINKLGEVSGYQRPVDHSTQYDHQQILILEDDPVVRTAAKYLFEKHPTVSSVYVLDNNQRPVLIRGDSVPLTEDSRLVLVGHGRKDSSGEMRLGGYEVQDVSKIIQQTSRDSNKIKTTSVVACDVGSDKAFIETLLKDLHDTAGIETKLHIRNAVLQVSHTGEKITQEITKDGDIKQWRHKDASKKVVATLDRNGSVIIRSEPGSKGKKIFTAERNFLGNDKKKNNKKISEGNTDNREIMEHMPRTFINQNVYEKLKDDEKKACNQLEAMSWGLFNQKTIPNKIAYENTKGYYVFKKLKEVEKVNDKELADILSNCYEIKSGEDIRNVILYYATTKENKDTYLSVNDWILKVDPKNLYVSLVGKRLDEKNEDLKKCIAAQIEPQTYIKMRNEIKTITKYSYNYAKYVEYIFRDKNQPEADEAISYQHSLSLSDEAWFTTYFTASVIVESARNFRTFPLILMALEMALEMAESIRETGRKFLLEEHSMASGGTWIDPNKRGFSGAADYESSDKSRNVSAKLSQLKTILEMEAKLYNSWSSYILTLDQNNNPTHVFDIARKYRITPDKSLQAYNKFITQHTSH
ncbi:uncharacterized protein LOC144514809, partial [Sander vitreus]